MYDVFRPERWSSNEPPLTIKHSIQETNVNISVITHYRMHGVIERCTEVCKTSSEFSTSTHKKPRARETGLLCEKRNLPWDQKNIRTFMGSCVFDTHRNVVEESLRVFAVLLLANRLTRQARRLCLRRLHMHHRATGRAGNGKNESTAGAWHLKYYTRLQLVFSALIARHNKNPWR